MFRVRPVTATIIAIAFLLTGCKELLATGQGPENDLEQVSGKSEGSARIPLNNDDMGIETLGDLDYLGGLVLTSKDKAFGGLSGLLVSDDGTRFLSVSDRGHWITGRLLYKGGELVGAREIKTAPMLGPDGQPFKGKEFSDAESLIGDLDGRVQVAFERNHRIWTYDLTTAGFDALPTPVALPDEVKKIKTNGGLEGIARLKDKAGTILALTEKTPDDRGNTKGWLVRPGGSSSISLKPIKPFKLTDLAVLPNGDVLTLERRFSLAGGPGFLIRRIAGATIQPGATLDGSVLANAGQPYSVDNMEGLDIRRDKNGRLLIYIISDDNFNPMQRTLLMMFALRDQT